MTIYYALYQYDGQSDYWCVIAATPGSPWIRMSRITTFHNALKLLVSGGTSTC